jgi:pilus assembly protein CpaE
MSTLTSIASESSLSDLSIALFGPDKMRRSATARDLAGCEIDHIREFASYPSDLESLTQILKRNFDVVMIDLDCNPDAALDLVERVRFSDPATVMVYSARNDPEMIVRSMRAGAREFLAEPFTRSSMAEAMFRAFALRPKNRLQNRTDGKLLVFLGAKGGSGVTTIASNFAVSLARESGKSTLLIDLNLPLGDAAINLGINAQYSVLDALQNSAKLDPSFLSTLLVKYGNGLSVLAAPGNITTIQVSNDAINKLLEVAREKFEYIVVDAGSRLDLQNSDLLDKSATVYLVTQGGISELRNSNRIVSQFFTKGGPALEVVVNRHDTASRGDSEMGAMKTLPKSFQWRVPNDYAAVRRMQASGIPLTLEDSPIARIIQQMSRSVCGQPNTREKKGIFSFFR